MRLEAMNEHGEMGTMELDELTEEVNDLKYRLYEDVSVYRLLTETEEESDIQKKLKEMKKHLIDAGKLAEKAEKLLADVIRSREEENQKIEDAILLRDGVMKGKTKKTEGSSV